MNVIKRILEKLKHIYAFSSSERAIAYWRSKGIVIGKNCVVPAPKTVVLDVSRPTLLTIGNNVRINRGLTIQTHDYASMVFVNLECEFIPSCAPIHIGNNVYFGQQCTVLKGVTIGDNCIIGFGSIVTKDIPSNSVATGRPAKVVCTIEEYIQKRKKHEVDEAINFALSFYERGKTPKVEDFYDTYTTFVDGSNYMEYDYPYLNIFTKEQFEQWKIYHKKSFNSFDDFMKEVNSRRKD